MAKSKTFSSAETKKALVAFVKEQCEKKGMLQDNYLYTKYGVTRVLKKLIEIGAIEPDEKVHNLYHWITDESVDTVAEVAWQRSGRAHLAPSKSTIMKHSMADRIQEAIHFMRRYEVNNERQLLDDVINGRISIAYIQPQEKSPA